MVFLTLQGKGLDFSQGMGCFKWLWRVRNVQLSTCISLFLSSLPPDFLAHSFPLCPLKQDNDDEGDGEGGGDGGRVHKDQTEGV